MELVTPGFGLFFWMLISFLLVVLVLKKFAWKPILSALREREKAIEDALLSAEKAKEERDQLEAEHRKIINETKQERDAILREARELKNQIIQEAKEKAEQESKKIVAATSTSIQNEKLAAVAEIRSEISKLSVEIAEKVLMGELDNNEKQEQLIKGYVKNFNFNHN